MEEREEKPIRCKCEGKGEIRWRTKPLGDGRRIVTYMKCNKCKRADPEDNQIPASYLLSENL